MSDFTNGPGGDPFDGYDPFDAELATKMRNLGGAAIDADAALAGMRPALQRARARRRARVAAGSLGLMLALSTAVFALTANGGPLGRTPISIRPETHDAHRSTTTSTGSQTAETDGPGHGPGNSSTASGDQGQGNRGPGVSTSTGTNTTTQSSGGGTGGTSTTPNNPTSSTAPATTSSTTIGTTTSTGNGATTTTTANGQQPQTFSGVGGSVTISWDATSITARSNQARSGYIATITTNIPDRYEVRFRLGSLTTDIKLRVANGVLQPPVINEH